MILTTNFDRLIESALMDEGIQPFTIYSDDDIDGCVRPVHIPQGSCIVYKINGDYKDTRMRNTPAELGTFSEKVDRYLDRSF